MDEEVRCVQPRRPIQHDPQCLAHEHPDEEPDEAITQHPFKSIVGLDRGLFAPLLAILLRMSANICFYLAAPEVFARTANELNHIKDALIDTALKPSTAMFVDDLRFLDPNEVFVLTVSAHVQTSSECALAATW
jgi:hypothetical protein